MNVKFKPFFKLILFNHAIAIMTHMKKFSTGRGHGYRFIFCGLDFWSVCACGIFSLSCARTDSKDKVWFKHLTLGIIHLDTKDWGTCSTFSFLISILKMFEN